MQFSQPAFLWGLLAVAIPIVIHLIHIRRYRKVYFSNVERLNELATEQRRHSRLRDWLILAARTLAVAFLVLAFARPVIASRPGAVRTGSTAVSIYIDNSFSMEQATSDGSLLDQAREKAREVAAAYALDDRFQLMTSDMTGEQMRLLSRDELFEALDGLHPSAATPMLSTVARRQQDFLHQARANNRHAYIISDFQTPTADLDALPADSSVLTTLVPLAGVEADNLYVDTLRFDAPAYCTGGSVDVEVTVRNSGRRDAEQVPVRLMVDGRERAIATLDLPAGGSAKATMHFTIDHAGYTDGTVTIEDYPVTFDDRMHFSLRVDDRVRLLEIDADRINPHLQRLFGGDSTVSHATATHLQHDLSQVDFLILNEYTALTSGDVQQLVPWVEQGGSLLVIPPPDAKTDGLDGLLAALQASRLGRWQPRQARGSAIDYDASLFRGVFSARSNDVEMPVVQGHYLLARTPHLSQPVITLSDGTPLLNVTHAGSGHLYLFTAPLRAESNSLVSQALFVPTLYNMALYSRPLPPAAYTLGDPDPIVLQGQHDMQRQPPALRGPDNFSLLPDLRQVGDRLLLILHGEATADGIYTLGDEHLALNHSRLESQMDFLAPQDIAKAISSRPGYTTVSHTARPITDELRDRDGGRQLWRAMLVLALLMLAIETMLIKWKR